MTPLDFRNTNSLWCSVLVETLVRCGVRQAVISPGSRSAPLTFAFARNAAIEAIPVLDERSAGFFALGLAKQHQRPTVLVCTSGTAAANFLPAVVEAHESGVPLLVFTADRPPEMRDCASGQTIDQQKLYGSYTVFTHEFAVPQATLPLLRYVRQTAVHAVERSLNPAGPVHLNCPFRDPLPPLPEKNPLSLNAGALGGFFDGLAPASAVRTTPPAFRAAAWRGEGVIVAGPCESPEGEAYAKTVGRLSRALGWPVLGDALSPVRSFAKEAGHLVTTYDALLRSEETARALRPDHVLCLGGWPTSKVLRAWLEASDPQVTLVSGHQTNRDALHLRTQTVHARVEDFAAAFKGTRALGALGKRWLEADQRVTRAFAKSLKELGADTSPASLLVEPLWAHVLASQLPKAARLFVASSMPVRDVEYFWPATNRGHAFFFNRGANGIDGTLSTALGVAHGSSQPTVLVTGDLALLHDTNGFLSVPKFKGSLTILLINNDGGGIFGHLPVAQFEPPFEEFFATPQQVDFAQLASAYGVPHVLVRNAAHLARLCSQLPARGVRVLELRTDRRQDAAFRKQLFARVSEKA